MLRIENLSYSFPQKTILKDISFEVGRGEVVAILGPNGTGKSTLLRLIAGDIIPQCGKVLFSGKEVLRYSSLDLARRRAVLVQQSQMTMNFSVKETVLMGRYPHFNGSPSKTDVDKAHKAMSKSSLSNMDQRIFTSLSGGEKQRVNFSRVLAQIWEGMEGSTGKLLLLDEPLNNLDIEHQHQTLEIACEFASKGNTVLVVLHDLNMAARFAGKLLLLSDAKLFAAGSPQEVLTSANIRRVFHYQAEVRQHPFLNCPMVYYGCCNKQKEEKTNLRSNLIEHKLN